MNDKTFAKAYKITWVLNISKELTLREKKKKKEQDPIFWNLASFPRESKFNICRLESLKKPNVTSNPHYKQNVSLNSKQLN